MKVLLVQKLIFHDCAFQWLQERINVPKNLQYYLKTLEERVLYVSSIILLAENNFFEDFKMQQKPGTSDM